MAIVICSCSPSFLPSLFDVNCLFFNLKEDIGFNRPGCLCNVPSIYSYIRRTQIDDGKQSPLLNANGNLVVFVVVVVVVFLVFFVLSTLVFVLLNV